MIRRMLLITFLYLMYVIKGFTQTADIPVMSPEQLEALTEKKDNVSEDDSYELDLEAFSRNPLNLNTATADDLIKLHLLSVMQVSNFISYRNLLGSFISVHEIQAIPGWDLETIHMLLPYIIVRRNETVYSALSQRWKGGDEAFLIRAGRVLEKSKGYEKPSSPDASYYEGSAESYFIRYLYNYKQLLEFGFTGEKDAGEPFLRSAQRYGFDFYSFHFFLRSVGIIKSLALGDFTVSLGQGLTQWQSFSIAKSSQVLAIKRESECIKPYHSSGEFNFHRGAAFSLQKDHWQASFFLSSQAISTNLVTDTANREDLFSSFQQTGYHRTATEIADRNNSREISYGGNICYAGKQFHMGLNAVYFQFSRPFQKRDEPYNLYSLKGKRLADFSMDYDYTYRNMHLFGEIAMDQWRSFAWIQGALISLAENLDMSLLYRNISPAYKSLYSDAFTESSIPQNEKGFYAGLAWRPFPELLFSTYYDMYHFPWLRYGVDAPSSGRDFLFSGIYSPNKSWRLTTLFKSELKTGNANGGAAGTHHLVTPLKQRWKIDTDYLINPSVHFNSLMEFLWIRQNGAALRQGYLGAVIASYQHRSNSVSLALMIFETDDYDSRIYAYEADLLYNFAIPAYFGKGFHYYINLHQDFSRLLPRGSKHVKLSGWLKWGQTFYPGSSSIGSGLDEIPGNRKSELKAEVLIRWQ
jgi:hypothetical protein